MAEPSFKTASHSEEQTERGRRINSSGGDVLSLESVQHGQLESVLARLTERALGACPGKEAAEAETQPSESD